MILGFHYHIPAQEKQGKIFTSGFLGIFLDALASKVDELICFMHTPQSAEVCMMDYALQGSNIRLISMGPHSSVPKRLWSGRRIVSSIVPEMVNLDIMLIRGPTPLLPFFSRVNDLKKAYLIVGDYAKSSKDLNQPFFRKKAIELWAKVNKIQQNKALKDAVVFVNNGLILEELKTSVKKLHLVKTTTLNPDDFFSREDTCQNNIIHLLYTGRLDLSKGLLEMIETLKRIRNDGTDAYLHFVGWEEKNLTVIKELLIRHAIKFDLNNFVIFHGKKQVGAELNAFYRMADIYIIGSKLNEGFPRTIWEAFANSVPVIASTVGSIPLFLKDNEHALFIKPGSADSMTSGVLKLLDNSALRRKLIRNGYEMAKEATLEIQCNRMIEILKRN